MSAPESDTDKKVKPTTTDIEKDTNAISITAEKPLQIDPKLEKHSHDADEALKAMEELHGEVMTIDEATNKRLLRTIDWHLMPIMCFIYGMNYLDKTALSYASVMGIKKSIHLSGDNYQWLGSLFYFGYLGWEYPTSRLLQRLPLGKYSAFSILMWGLVLSCFAAVKNFSGAIAIRFFLGVFEASVTPGFALLTSQWYTKEEQGKRVNIWFSFNGWGQVLGGIIAYGIAVGTEKYGSAIDPWKIVFLVTGLFTFALGIIFLWIVPDNQLNARWLRKEDRVLAVARVRENQQGIGNKHWKWYQVKEAFLDPMTWAFFFLALINDIPNGGLTNFFNQLITSFGYSQVDSLVLGIPLGAVEVISLVLNGILGDRYQERILFGIAGVIVSIVGMIVVVALPMSNNIGRLLGYYLTNSSPTGFVALLSLISTNVAGYTKKTTVAALYLIGYCVGNIIGPQTFQPEDAPQYVPAEITIIVCGGVSVLLLWFIRWWYVRENAKKRQIRESPGYVKMENQEWMDLTDKENHEFVYSL